MNADEKDREVMKERPQIYFSSIRFNDDTILKLEKNSIVVFTGPNNSGKSQVLKDLELSLDCANHADKTVIKSSENNYYGEIDEDSFFEEHFLKGENGNYRLLECGHAFDTSSLKRFWQGRTLYNELYKVFVNRLSTEKRLSASNALIRNDQPEQHPIYRLNKNEELAQKISDYFCEAFGVDLIVNRNEMKTIPLHVGKAPDKSSYTIDRQDEYYNIISKLPKLQEQGDGMSTITTERKMEKEKALNQR